MDINSVNGPPRILLYGNSIWIERLVAKLREGRGWDVTRVHAGAIKDGDDFTFIVTDLCDVSVSESLPMLSAMPGVMLIGVDAIACTATVLTGRTHPPADVQGVLDALLDAL